MTFLLTLLKVLMKTSSKTLSSLIDDMYSTLEGCEKISEEQIQLLSKLLTDTITNRLSQSSKRRDHLSLSSISSGIGGSLCAYVIPPWQSIFAVLIGNLLETCTYPHL